MDTAKLFSNEDLTQVKKVVWQESVVPYILNKNTNLIQKTLLWIAEHTLAGATIGILSVGAIGVFAWETTKNIDSRPNLTEIVFKQNNYPLKSNQNTKDKVYTKGTFQPIIVETDSTLQPLDQITSGKQQDKAPKTQTKTK